MTCSPTMSERCSGNYRSLQAALRSNRQARCAVTRRRTRSRLWTCLRPSSINRWCKPSGREMEHATGFWSRRASTLAKSLTEAGDYAAAARAHASMFTTLAEELDRTSDTTPDRTWLARAEPELENFRTALQWALVERGDVLAGQRLAGALLRVWFNLDAAEGRRWVQIAQALVDDGTPPQVIAALEFAQAHLDATFVQYKASFAAGERALARYCELGDAYRIAQAQQCVGYALIMLGKIAEGEECTDASSCSGPPPRSAPVDEHGAQNPGNFAANCGRSHGVSAIQR